jgi:hypothetical protein
MVVILFYSCRKPYNPPASSSPLSYLVVEGTINTNGVTSIILSNSVSLTDASGSTPVAGATLAIQSSKGASYPLTAATQAGLYQSANLTLDNSQQYRISIATPDGKQYLSDFAAVMNDPPIDSVGFNITGTGVQVYVNTHDATNTTKYFRWSYGETWIFHSYYGSLYVTNGTAIYPRTSAQNISSCFASDTSYSILLGSTADLRQSVVNQSLLTTIAPGSEKLESEYSINVHQYALSPAAYNFWTTLKKNTEDLGSIFDPQPSNNMNGNIHNIANAAELVIGYIDACAVQTRRVFFFNFDTPSTPKWATVYPYSCTLDSEWYHNPHTGQNDVQATLIPLTSTLIPVTSFPNPPTILGFLSSDTECTDCTIRGTTTVPPYWKY